MSFLEGLQEFKNKEKEVAIKSPPLKKFDLFSKLVKQWATAWPPQDTGTNILRASGMYFMCPREFVLNYWRPKPNKVFGCEGRIMADMGTITHTFLQDSVLGPMGILKGKWYSRESKETLTGYHPDPERALGELGSQVPSTWTYVEPDLWSAEYRISGHVDGILDRERLVWLLDNKKILKQGLKHTCSRVHSLPEGKTESLLEVKTTGDYQFQKVEGLSDIPAYYKMQAAIYQKLSGIDKTVFWYVSRDNIKFWSGVYDFEECWWNEAKRKAKTVWESIRDRTLPEGFMACKTPKDKRAKECVHSPECWQKWKDNNFNNWIDLQVSKQPYREWLDLSGKKFD